jgi:hypothetical protein
MLLMSVGKYDRLESFLSLECTMLEMKVSDERYCQKAAQSKTDYVSLAAYAYQPEALQKIFQRAMSGKDIASGSSSASDATYKTTGASSTWSHKNKAPCPPKPLCYVLVPSTCSDLQMDAYTQGYAIVKDFVFTGFTPNVPSYLDPPYRRPENQPKIPGC